MGSRGTSPARADLDAVDRLQLRRGGDRLSDRSFDLRMRTEMLRDGQRGVPRSVPKLKRALRAVGQKPAHLTQVAARSREMQSRAAFVHGERLCQIRRGEAELDDHLEKRVDELPLPSERLHLIVHVERLADLLRALRDEFEDVLA